MTAAIDAATEFVDGLPRMPWSTSGTVTVDGRTAGVPPDAATMSAVADRTGGEAFEATDAAELGAVYDDLEARIGTTSETRELTLGFVAAGLVALLLAVGAGFLWTGRFL